MGIERDSSSPGAIIDEIIDNASCLSAEQLRTLLLLARGMAYTHKLLTRPDGTPPPSSSE